MWTYLAGYDITKLKKFISFWFFTLVVGISFARQWITLLKTRFENNKIERIVYEEKIIYVPEEIDQYEDNDLIEPVAESAPITITQIDEESQVLSPTNILDTTDTQWETLAQQLLRLTADENNTQEGRDELVELQ